jgi:hypothetical protein
MVHKAPWPLKCRDSRWWILKVLPTYLLPPKKTKQVLNPLLSQFLLCLLCIWLNAFTLTNALICSVDIKGIARI